MYAEINKMFKKICRIYYMLKNKPNNLKYNFYNHNFKNEDSVELTSACLTT